MAKVGRPKKYETVEDLEKVIDDYFAECNPHWELETYYDHPWIETKDGRKRDYKAEMVKQKRRIRTEQKPYTMAGLARRLNMTRQSLSRYNDSDQFSDTIKAARAVVEEFNESLLLSGKYATGAIFNLKVNFDYRDEAEQQAPPENRIAFVNLVPVPPDD